MWLLNTSSGKLASFNGPSEVKYAILSHCWRDKEQTFQDLQRLGDSKSVFPNGYVPKIRDCCLYARQEGYEWVWIDTCCIDKTSSAELSEAINSMFAWYAEAQVCYAYLDDVPDMGTRGAREDGSLFRKSRWWTRGWTLQELIAPNTVIFLSQSWAPIASKDILADVVEEISGVDCAVIFRNTSVHEVSVARRMSWASRRQTTREEDRAYSLMGIFGVNMPTIYGERGRAFIRLQEEILKHIPDQSIFAWGPVLHDYPFACRGFLSESPVQSGQRMESSMYDDPTCTNNQVLLAPSPDQFRDAGAIHPISIFDRQWHISGLRKRYDAVDNPYYNFTSYGVRTEFPVIRYRLAPRLSFTAPVNVLVAVLACEDDKHRLVLLLLRRKETLSNDHFIGDFAYADTEGRALLPTYYRVMSLVPDAPLTTGFVTVRDVYIHNPLHQMSPYEAHYYPRNPAMDERDDFLEFLVSKVRAIQTFQDHNTRVFHILSSEDAIFFPLIITLNLMATTRSAALAICIFGTIYSTISTIRTGFLWTVLGDVLEFFKHDDRYENTLIKISVAMCMIRITAPTIAILVLVPRDVLHGSDL